MVLLNLARSVFALAVLANTVSATTSACTSGWLNCAISPISGTYWETQTTVTNSAACDNFCRGGFYRYAYFRASNHNCLCGTLPLPISQYRGSTGTGPTCPSSSYSVNMLNPQYAPFVQCLSNDNGMVRPTHPNANTIAACYTACAGIPSTYAAFKANGGGGTCYCFNSYSGKATTCGSGNIYVWHYCGPVHSGGHHHKARDLDRQKALLEANPFCPIGFEACRISSSDLDERYECLDTSSELESCGGCVFGSMKNASATDGVDCLSLPGVSTTSVTCSAGKCKAWRCLRGFKLINNECVRE